MNKNDHLEMLWLCLRCNDKFKAGQIIVRYRLTCPSCGGEDLRCVDESKH